MIDMETITSLSAQEHSASITYMIRHLCGPKGKEPGTRRALYAPGAQPIQTPLPTKRPFRMAGQLPALGFLPNA
jgi:hypothetical protein